MAFIVVQVFHRIQIISRLLMFQ